MDPHALIHIHDDVLPDPLAYRQMALAQAFASLHRGPAVFHGIAPCPDPCVTDFIVTHYPGLMPTQSVFRQSPWRQQEPNYIHTDASMGEWTAICYLNPHPPAGDGTRFWQSRLNGVYQGAAFEDPARAAEALLWYDESRWACWQRVAAKLGRLVLFPARCFHSRALPENYGEGDRARLIQIVFGVGEFPCDDY